MRVGDIFTESAVSPVVGVVLMVAIAVTLAAVVGTVVLKVDRPRETAPHAEFDFEQLERPPSGHDEVRVTHVNGEPVQNTNLYVVTEEGVRDTDGTPASDARLTWYRLAKDDGASAGDALSAQDSVEFETTATEIETVEIRLVWQPASDAPSAVLDRWRTT